MTPFLIADEFLVRPGEKLSTVRRHDRLFCPFFLHELVWSCSPKTTLRELYGILGRQDDPIKSDEPYNIRDVHFVVEAPEQGEILRVPLLAIPMATPAADGNLPEYYVHHCGLFIPEGSVTFLQYEEPPKIAAEVAVIMFMRGKKG